MPGGVQLSGHELGAALRFWVGKILDLNGESNIYLFLGILFAQLKGNGCF